MIRINVTSVLVDDQAKALAFYTEKLGFIKKTDVPAGGARWLTVVSPEEPDGVELLLSPMDDPARTFQHAMRAAGKPATSFTVDDARREHERLVSLGVAFVMEPTKMPYGGTDAVFEDGCGNLLNLHQD